MPANAKNECCRDDENLGPVEDGGKGTAVHPVTGETLTMDRGYRRCTVCGARHFFMKAEPGVIGLRGTAIGEGK